MSITYPKLPVFIVDDEVNDLECMETILETEGIFNIRTCDDSRVVLEKMHEEKMGVVLLDLIMPHKPGDELLQIITNEFPDIPVIIITGNNDIETAVHCIKKGAFDYIVKPVDEGTLLESVKTLLGR